MQKITKNNKQIFWKLLAVLFLIWLYLYLWVSSIDIYRLRESPSIKYNRLTDRVYKLTKKGWQRIN